VLERCTEVATQPIGLSMPASLATTHHAPTGASHVHQGEAVRAADTHHLDLATDRTAPADGAETRETHEPTTLATAGWILLAILGLGGFAAVTLLVAGGYVFPFDQPLLDAGRGLGQYMDAWRGLSDSANLPLIAIGVSIVAWLLWTRRRLEAGLVILILAAVTAGSEAVKQAVARPRPPGFDTSVIGVVYSYPSGHVLEAVTIYGIIAILVWRSRLPGIVRIVVPVAFAIVIAFVAVARVAVGAHYPSDVLAGFLGGIGVVALFALLTSLIAMHRRDTAG
jgi:undecaprenyl-diphosphatase